MGKRKHSDANEYDYIAKKVMKLNKRLMRARQKDRRRTPSSSSDTSSSSSERSSSASPRPGSRAQLTFTPRDALCITDVPRNVNGGAAPIPSTSVADGSAPSTSAADGSAPSTSAVWEPVPSTSTAGLPLSSTSTTEQPLLSISTAPNQAQTISAAPEFQATDSIRVTTQLTTDSAECSPGTQLNEDLLQILGEDPSRQKFYGKDVQPDLAIRLQHLATLGLPKEARKALLDKYLPPENCSLIDAPALNPEVKAAMTEAIYKRDKAIELKQKQLSCVIACLAETLTTLMAEGGSTSCIQSLMDACKLLCDSQYTDSLTRRNFVLSNIKKELKDQLQATKIHKLLFREELSDALKAAKAISKSSADLKLAGAKAPNKKSSKPAKNWRAPPPNQSRMKGNQRSKEPAYRSRQENSSKQLSHPAQSRSRRR